MENWRTKATRTLHRSESFFQTDMVYLAKGGFWLSLSQGAAILSGFLLSLAFANLLPKESFGTYKFILSMAGIVGIFSLAEISTSVTQAVARGFGGSLRQGFKSSLKWSIGILIGGLALSIYYYLNGNNLLAISFLLAGILSPITLSASLYGAHLLGKKDFQRSAFYGLVRNILPAIALVLTLFLTQNLLIIIAVYFISSALISLLLYYFTRHAYKNDNEETDPNLVSYGKHLSFMDIIGNGVGYLDKIIIFHYLGAVPLAIFAFAIAPVEQLQGGKKILRALILPKLSERPFEELQKSVGRKTVLFVLYSIAIALIYVLLAPYFYKFFFPQYIESVFYSQIYAFTLLAVFGVIFEDVLVAHKKKKELYIHRITIPVLKVVLFLVLLPLFGLWGFIVAHIAIRFISSILAYYFVKHPLTI